MSTSILHMRINSDTKEILEVMAKEQNRTLSNLVETVLKQYIAAESPPPKPRHRG